MIEVSISSTQYQRALDMAKEMGQLNNSITKGDGNLAGFIGEVVLSDLLGWTQANTYDYDLITPEGHTVDVKTKRTKVAPKPYYECSVAAYNTRQNCDFYAFCRVDNGFEKLWFLGIIEKQKYFQNARLLRAGDKDGDNGFIVHADCYNMAIGDLWEQSNIKHQV